MNNGFVIYLIKSADASIKTDFMFLTVDKRQFFANYAMISCNKFLCLLKIIKQKTKKTKKKKQ